MSNEQTNELDELNARITQVSPDTGGTYLPFPAFYIYFQNGDAKLSKIGGIDAFGGWASSDPEKTDNAAKSIGVSIPESWERGNGFSKSKEFERYAVGRSVLVAFIAARQYFENKQDQQRVAVKQYYTMAKNFSETDKKGWSFKQQTLTLMGAENGKGISAFAPTVLTVSGYNQIKNFNAVFQEWNDKSAAIRKKLFPNADGKRNFYVRIGTFGKDPEIKVVGREGAQSTITPIGIDYDLTEDWIQKAFVGMETFRQMVSLAEQAKMWLVAIENRKESNATPEPPEESEDIPGF